LHGITGALLQEGVGDLVVNVLLEHVLVRELHVPVEILQPGRLAEAEELVVDEAILSLSTSSIIA
jgi:4-hydroxy-3-methylbut-2-en-1-yl diphosphate synthase IspG/GcpE